MRTRVFSPTYPTWALVGGTSRPAGETVQMYLLSTIISTRYLDGAGVQDDQLRGDADRPGQRDQPLRTQLGEVSSQQLDNCRHYICSADVHHEQLYFEF